MYQGEMARDTEGHPVRGQYDAVLGVETWESVRSALTEPARGRAVHTGGRKYMLTGIARCSLSLVRGFLDALDALDGSGRPTTFEGTEQIQQLVIARAISGLRIE